MRVTKVQPLPGDFVRIRHGDAKKPRDCSRGLRFPPRGGHGSDDYRMKSYECRLTVPVSSIWNSAAESESVLP